MTHDVTLPYAQTPRFPLRCVVCAAPHPGTIAKVTVLIAVAQQGLGADLVDLALGSSSSGSKNVRITLKPAVCPSCQPSLQRYHFWKQVWQYLGPLLGVAVAMLCLLKTLTLLAIGAGIVGIVAPVIYELVFPPTIGATGSGRTVIYEFRSQRYAQEFAQLNPDPNHPPDPEPPADLPQ